MAYGVKEGMTNLVLEADGKALMIKVIVTDP
jgi:hypothetical protein